MPDDSAATTTETPPETGTPPSSNSEPSADHWKAQAKEWEKRAREHKRAADKLAELENAQKTDAQKAIERAEAAERELATFQANALRSEVALEKGLTASQAKRLLGSSREELEADAEQLIADLGDAAKPRTPRPDPNQGRASTGSASNADLFAAAVEGSFTR